MTVSGFNSGIRIPRRYGPIEVKNTRRNQPDHEGERKMGTRVFFDNAIRRESGFSSKPYPKGPGEDMYFGGLAIFAEGNRLYAHYSDGEPVPEEVRSFMMEISRYESIPRMGQREAGIYHHGTAECEVTPGDEGNTHRERLVYKLITKGKKMEDVNEIIHLVKAGLIRPEVSYEGRQGGLSRAELEEKVRQLESELKSEKLCRHEDNEASDKYIRTLQQQMAELEQCLAVARKPWYKRLAEWVHNLFGGGTGYDPNLR